MGTSCVVKITDDKYFEVQIQLLIDDSVFIQLDTRHNCIHGITFMIQQIENLKLDTTLMLQIHKKCVSNPEDEKIEVNRRIKFYVDSYTWFRDLFDHDLTKYIYIDEDPQILYEVFRQMMDVCGSVNIFKENVIVKNHRYAIDNLLEIKKIYFHAQIDYETLNNNEEEMQEEVNNDKEIKDIQ
jgi:hypothetical protein